MQREMKRKERLVTERAWMEDVLRCGQVLHLGLIGDDGWPYVVPLGYGYEDGVVYLHGASEGYKNDLVRENPKVCFQVFVDASVARADVGSGFSMYYRSVTGFGHLTAISELQEQNRALEILMRQYDGPHQPLTQTNPRLWVARIDILQMTGKNNPNPGRVA